MGLPGAQLTVFSSRPCCFLCGMLNLLLKPMSHVSNLSLHQNLNSSLKLA